MGFSKAISGELGTSMSIVDGKEADIQAIIEDAIVRVLKLT